MTSKLSPYLACVSTLLLSISFKPTTLVTGTHSAAAPLRIVTDGIGRKVHIPTHPRRIVSMAPSVTETLFALGAGDRVVGVTDFCDYPAAARTKARIGGMINPNWEAILNLKPDLLIATTAGNDRDVLARTAALRLPVLFLDSPDIGSLLGSFDLLGNVLESRAEASALRSDLALRLRKLDARASAGPRPTVLFLVWGDPIVVPGRGTFLDDALKRTGCDSITSKGPPGWPTYNLETLLARDPQWILATEQNAAFLKSLKERPGWSKLDAVLRD